MKATQRDFAVAAPKAVRQCRLFFFCGPDEAGASAAADRIAAMLDDPGERVELAGGDLRKDPALLGDEARSSSLFGDARHIYVRASGDEAHDALVALIESTEAEGIEAAPVLVVAQSATDKSRTAKLLEKRADALVAMFYPPDLQSVAQEVRRMGDAAGLKLDGALAERIARAAGLDVRLAKSEVEKLALYLDADPQSPKSANAEALDAIGAVAEDDAFAPLVNAVLAGETGRLSGELKRMRELGMNPVGLLLAFERRAAQLAGLAARIGPNGNVRNFVKAESNARRIFFRDAPDIERQLHCWRGRRLERLTGRLIELHQTLLASNQSAELRLAQGLAEISRFAAASVRTR
jgi:DNA polymerase-3 subunit delta